MPDTLIDPLVELTPGPTRPVAEPILGARRAIIGTFDDLLTVPDDRLESDWPWRAGDPTPADVRYGFYRIHERLEAAAADIGDGRAASGEGEGIGPAVALFGPATAARWELRAALAPLTEADLDRDPGGGEWSIRQTLGHIVSGQRAYGWYTAWWYERGHAPGPLPASAGDARMPPEIEDEDEIREAIGTPPEILARLDELVDLGMGRFAGLDLTDLSTPARWSGLPVDVRFRIGRWGSHIREHTIQIDKTLLMTGRPTTEVERLIRLIGASFGRLESLVFGRSDEVLQRRWATGSSPAEVITSCAADVGAVAASVRRAAAGPTSAAG